VFILDRSIDHLAFLSSFSSDTQMTFIHGILYLITHIRNIDHYCISSQVKLCSETHIIRQLLCFYEIILTLMSGFKQDNPHRLNCDRAAIINQNDRTRPIWVKRDYISRKVDH
jgi:hypothetical protein